MNSSVTTQGLPQDWLAKREEVEAPKGVITFWYRAFHLRRVADRLPGMPAEGWHRTNLVAQNLTQLKTMIQEEVDPL